MHSGGHFSLAISPFQLHISTHWEYLLSNHLNPLTMKIDYSLDFAENANNLMEKLLKEYPGLEE